MAFMNALASLVRRLLELELVDNGELTVGHLGGQSGAHGQLDFLVVHAEGVAARMRTEHGTAASPLRGADGALAGTAGALLAPRLLAAAADLAAGEGVAGALARQDAR